MSHSIIEVFALLFIHSHSDATDVFRNLFGEIVASTDDFQQPC